MGGVVPLGYDVADRKLVINEAEARTVRTLFQLYQEHANTLIVKEEADRLGLRTKRRNHCTGKSLGGEPFTRGHFHKVLTNWIYIGETTHKGASYPGEHSPIIDRDLWDAVQAQLAQNAVVRRNGRNAKSPSPLTGLLQTADGGLFSPSHASKKRQRYRYYVSKGRTADGDGSPGREAGRYGKDHAGGQWRLPAPALESLVVDSIGNFLSGQHRLAAVLAPDAPAGELGPLFARATAWAIRSRHRRTRSCTHKMDS